MNAVAEHPTSSLYTSDEQRWLAVVHRDAGADGAFYYSVRTTGVYCRPSCASRLARRENVRFHASMEDAERAGFRACKRCKPRLASLEERRMAAVVTACRLMDSSDDQSDLDTVAASAGLSRFHFHRLFKASTGLTPKEYADAQRVRRLRDALPGSPSVTKAVYGAGFSSSGQFYAKASGILGMPASSYRAGGRGMTIRFAVGECSLGAVLVAATEVGVCSILLGDEPEALVRDLQDRFASAEIVGGDRAFEAAVAQVVGFIDQPARGLDLPLDICGTAFQQRVWQALREIPCGETASYTEVARKLGMPKSVRAVAHACAANPIAVAIPFHRVVRTDGSLSGYRWGIERKSKLLALERASTNP